MQSLMQPIVDLSTANVELITRFAQSQEMVELANASAQKYFELAQKTFGGVAAAEGHAELVRCLTEKYSTFAREHAQSLMGSTAEGQTQMQAAMGPLTEGARAAAAVVAEASKLASQVGAPWKSLVDNRTA